MSKRIAVIKVSGAPPILPPGNITPGEWLPVKDGANIAAEFVPILAARRYDIESFGARRGRGMSQVQRQANTDAINAAAAATLATATDLDANGVPLRGASVGAVVMKGEYEVLPGIELTCNVEAGDASLVVYGAGASGPPALFVGTRADSNLWGARLSLPKVRPNSASATWGTDAVGIELCNLVSCMVEVPDVSSFGVGLTMTAREAKGNVSSRISLGTLYDNTVNLLLETIGAASWVNELKFFGGHFVVSTSRGPKIPGMRHIVLRSTNSNMINNNIFYAPNLEGNGPEYHVEFENGRHNTIHDARWEVPGAAYQADILCHAGSHSNLFLNGYTPEKVNIVNQDTAQNNFALNRFSVLHSGTVVERVGQLGERVGAQRVFDAHGTLIGYIPIYDTIGWGT